MTYRVVLTLRAADQLESAAQWWEENRSVKQAALWYAGFSDAINSL